VHKELLKLIEIRDPSGARRLMDDHVKMIRARRVAEHGKTQPIVPAQAGTQDRQSKRSEPPLGSRLRGNERGLRVGNNSDDDAGCC